MELLCVLLAILLTVVVFLEVFCRYVLQAPLAWSEEFALFIFGWCLFIGAALGVRHRSLYNVDLIHSRLPVRWRTACEIISHLLLFFLAYLMIHIGYKMVCLTLPQKYPILEFSKAYGYLAIVVSGALMIIYNMPIFFRQMRTLIRRS
jgi:TRAP-type C4-dicarboxylate transport system permease small subunit